MQVLRKLHDTEQIITNIDPHSCVRCIETTSIGVFPPRAQLLIEPSEQAVRFTMKFTKALSGDVPRKRYPVGGPHGRSGERWKLSSSCRNSRQGQQE